MSEYPLPEGPAGLCGFCHTTHTGKPCGTEDRPLKGIMEQKRERPSFESLIPKEPCAGILCPICRSVLHTRADTVQHWEAGHFDTMHCSCGFNWGIGSSHGHIVEPSLAKMPLSDTHRSTER